MGQMHTGSLDALEDHRGILNHARLCDEFLPSDLSTQEEVAKVWLAMSNVS